MHAAQHDTDPAPPAPDTIATTLRIGVAVDQLTQPGQHYLDRDHAAARQQLHELDVAHLARIRYLRQRRADALARGAVDPAARALCAMTTAGQQHRAARARLTAGLAPARARLPALLHQLLDAVANSSNTGAGGNSGPAAHRSPIGLAALALVGDIQRHVGNRDRTLLEHDLRAWAEYAEHLTPDDATAAERWAEQARSILEPNPSKTRGLAGRCLHCDNGHVTVVDDTGDPVRKRALQVDETTAVHCLACGDRTPPWKARILAAALDQQRADDEADRTRQAAPGRPR